VTVPHRRAIAALLAAVLFVAVAVLAPDPAFSAGGALDTTFDTDGSTTLDFGNGTDSISDLVLQADGKVVAVGPSGTGFGLVRYTTAGVLDTTFGLGGITSGAFMSDARDLAIQSDGKIVVVGRSASTNGSLVVARYTAAGVLDATFDTDGRATIAMTGASSGGLAVALQSDSKAIVLANDNGLLSVIRFTTAGVPDVTFDVDGRVDTTATPSFTHRLAVQSDGKIVFTVGDAAPAGGAMRLTTAGLPDATFGTSGVALSANHVARGLTLQTDGKVITVGDLGSSGNQAVVVRRNTEGALDSTFGTSGVAAFSVPGLLRASAHGVAVQSDGKIVVTGRLDDTPTTSSVYVARLTAAGVLDTTFASAGIATFTTLATKSTSAAAAVAVDSTGRFVVGGAVVSSSGIPNDTDFAVLRLLATDAPATTTTTTRPPTTTTTVPGQVPAGTTVRSDPDGTVPSLGNELIASVTTPVAGVVTFAKGDGTAVAGYRTLAGMTITAPTASAAAPHRFTFQLDASTIPDGLPLGGIEVLKNDVPVVRCASATVAAPDPCVLSRSRIDDVYAVQVLTSTASTWKLTRPVLQRIAGATRFASAIALSQTQFGDDGADAVVLVRSDGFADALAAAPLAVAKGAPLLLSSSSALDDDVLVEIIRVLRPGGKVYLLGGTGALSDSVADRILAWGFTVQRIAGDDRFETAVAVARIGLDSPNVIVETTAHGFADALAAGAVASYLGGAVLLTDGSSPAEATLDYIADERPTRFALGGPAALADPEAESIVGEDRYETAVLAAFRFFPLIEAIGFASGTSFADALAGGSHAGRAGAPLILVPQTGVLPVSVDILLASAELAPPAAYLYGGTGSVDDGMAGLLRTSLGG
jgi:uncharacterized delta-60 repeat protein